MDEVEVTRNGRTKFSVTPVYDSDPIQCIVSVASVSIPDERSEWASKTPIMVHPFGGIRDGNDPLLNFASNGCQPCSIFLVVWFSLARELG